MPDSKVTPITPFSSINTIFFSFPLIQMMASLAKQMRTQFSSKIKHQQFFPSKVRKWYTSTKYICVNPRTARKANTYRNPSLRNSCFSEVRLLHILQSCLCIAYCKSVHRCNYFAWPRSTVLQTTGPNEWTFRWWLLQELLVFRDKKGKKWDNTFLWHWCLMNSMRL